nr:MAG TPA: hypothetical protein [Caudoviricetes sp.]
MRTTIIVLVATRLRHPSASQLAENSLSFTRLFNKVPFVAMTSIDNSNVCVGSLLTKDVCLRACNFNQFLFNPF